MTRPDGKNASEEQYPVGSFLPGTEWVVRGELGRGGMGVVLDVWQEPGFRAAIKVLQPKFARDAAYVKRFKREIEFLIALEHPNIVQVRGGGQLTDGSPYLVMERLQGRTLRAAARALAEADGRRLSARDVHKVASQICGALDFAHTRNPPIVHRDLKPENIYIHEPPVGDEGVIKLIDFGVAELLEGTSPPSRGLVGTLKYMPPEVLRGEPIGPKADLYAVAMIIYELLTLRLPWDVEKGNNAAITAAHMRLPPIPPSQFVSWLPESVERSLLQGLSKDPADRQATVNAFCHGLWDLQTCDDGSAYADDDANTTVPGIGALGRGWARRAEESAPERDADTVRHALPGEALEDAVDVSLAALDERVSGEAPERNEGVAAADATPMEHSNSSADIAVPESAAVSKTEEPRVDQAEATGAVVGAAGADDGASAVSVGAQRAARRSAYAGRSVRWLSGGLGGLAVLGALGLGIRGGRPKAAAAGSAPPAWLMDSASPPSVPPVAAPSTSPTSSVAAAPMLPVAAAPDAAVDGAAAAAELPNLGVMPLPAREAVDAALGLRDAGVVNGRERAAAPMPGRPPSPRRNVPHAPAVDDGADLIWVPK